MSSGENEKMKSINYGSFLGGKGLKLNGYDFVQMVYIMYIIYVRVCTCQHMLAILCYICITVYVAILSALKSLRGQCLDLQNPLNVLSIFRMNSWSKLKRPFEAVGALESPFAVQQKKLEALKSCKDQDMCVTCATLDA